jgi:hypothetical protein
MNMKRIFITKSVRPKSARNCSPTKLTQKNAPDALFAPKTARPMPSTAIANKYILSGRKIVSAAANAIRGASLMQSNYSEPDYYQPKVKEIR